MNSCQVGIRGRIIGNRCYSSDPSPPGVPESAERRSMTRLNSKEMRVGVEFLDRGANAGSALARSILFVMTLLD